MKHSNNKANRKDPNPENVSLTPHNLIRTFADKAKIYIELSTAVLLSAMAIASLWVSFLQYRTMDKQTHLIAVQTDLAKMQADLAKSETIQNERNHAIASARDWSDLRHVLSAVYEKSFFLAGKEGSIEDKLNWIAEMQILLEPLGANSVLIERETEYNQYLRMITFLSQAKHELMSIGSSNVTFLPKGTPPQVFIDGAHKEANRAMRHVYENSHKMWFSLGMWAPPGADQNPCVISNAPIVAGFSDFPWMRAIRTMPPSQQTDNFEHIRRLYSPTPEVLSHSTNNL